MVGTLTDDLDALRKRIIAVDRQIFALAAKRFHLVARVGDLKKQQGLPVVNFHVETDVLRRALERGEALHLPAGFVSKLSNLLIQESVVVQEGSSPDRMAYLSEVAEQVKALEAEGVAVIQLHTDEPDVPTPPQVTAEASTDLHETARMASRPSQGLPELRRAIAAALSQQHHRAIHAEQVVITPDGQFTVFVAFLARISMGDRVLLPEPTWPVYDACARLAGGRVDVIHTRLEDDWRLSMEELEEALAVHPQLLVVSTPHNPTGTILSETDLEEIGRLAAARGTVVLSDERHSGYASMPVPSILDVVASPFIYVNSFSATWGRTRWRIGYAVSDPATTARMTRLLQLSSAWVHPAIQQAAVDALPIHNDVVDARSTELEDRIDLACNELITHPLSFTRPTGGMYLFPRVNLEGFDSRAFTRTLLATKRVAVAPGEAFGAYPDHFRLSLNAAKRDIKEGVKRIGTMLEAWR